MRRVEKIAQDLSAYLSGKRVLEVACCDSDFSLAASRFAEEVLATDISLERAKRIKLDALKDAISEYRDLISLTEIHNSKCSALVGKKGTY